MGTTRRVTTATVVAAAVLVSGTAAVAATGRFDDVGEKHPYRDEVEALAGAGITTGWPDGTYRPRNELRREGMAAFLGRGLGRAGHATGQGRLGHDVDGEVRTEAGVASLSIDAGGTGGGTGFVLLQGTASVYSATGPATDLGACPCEVELFVEEVGSGATGPSAWTDLPAVAGDSGFANASAAVTVVLPLPADTTGTYRLVARLGDRDVDRLVVEGALTGLYVPFGPQGDDRLTDDTVARRDPTWTR